MEGPAAVSSFGAGLSGRELDTGDSLRKQVTRRGSGAGSSLSSWAISGGAWNTDSPWHRAVSGGPNIHGVDWEGVWGWERARRSDVSGSWCTN